MTPFEHQVRERAYYIWEDEGRMFGHADDHWLRAEAELSALASPALVVVQAASPAMTLSASPAALLGESLKTKPSRARTAAKAEPAPKAAKATAKTAAEAAPAAKPAAVKPATAKAASAKAAKPAAAKTAVTKSAATKSAAAKAPAKTPKIAARPRTADAVATVH